ncbi:hypothetical protein EJ08DRAFT_373359 [Tothia fuscella]|uniref:Rhodopsin domain-containing protein n=1 Tax=Tothia fuscella TaxID=1048955 RepID=A0A9P4NM12_9PEZI|nr:hypothetical protein EJ08DRAFT_373359 [Tothia fuscella]
MIDVPVEFLQSFPPGSPNTINPVTRGHSFWGVSALFLSAATVCVAARLYHRIFVRHWFGRDDVLIIIAFLSTVAVTTSVSIANVHYDWDKHIWDMQPKHYQASLIILYLTRIFWGTATSCVRLSILCLYYRLLDRCGGPKKFRWVLHGVTAIADTRTRPVRAYWVWPPMPQSSCINDGLSLEICAILNTISELVIALLPVFAVYGLNVDPRQRWNVIGLLSLGFFVVIAGIVRTYFLFKTVQTHDTSWWSTPHWICSEVEIDIALICACAASLRPMVGNILRGMNQTRFALPHPLPKLSKFSQKASKATSSVGTTTLDTSVDWDHEGATHWNALMSRTIDLEGIGEDGFGYTVQITGPTSRAPHTKRRWLRRRNQSSQRPGSVISLEPTQGVNRVRAKSTFEVAEEYRSPVMTKPSNGVFKSFDGTDGGTGFDFDQGVLDWSLLDAPEAVTALPSVKSGT